MRHLVTGGAGFIGSHLIDHLLQDPVSQVICVDNFLSGSRRNLADWLPDSRLEVIRHDVTEPLRLEVDRIWHLACPASPRLYQRNPVATAKICVLGTLNLLGLAKRCGARLLLASTSEVYGDPLVHPQSETYLGNVNCTGPRACYDEGKRMAETLCFDYARLHGVSLVVARIFNTYGPRMSSGDGRVISNFLTQALLGQPLTVYGDGQQTRSFCYIDDLVNPNLQVVHAPLPVDDPQRRCPAIDRADSLLGWRPRITLDEGLQRTLSDLVTQLRQPVSVAA